MLSDRSQTTTCNNINPVLRPENANMRLRISGGSGTRRTVAIDFSTGAIFTANSAVRYTNTPAAMPTRFHPRRRLTATEITYTKAPTKAPRVLSAAFSAAELACEGTNVIMLGTMLKTSSAELVRYAGSTIVNTATMLMAIKTEAITVCAQRLKTN